MAVVMFSLGLFNYKNYKESGNKLSLVGYIFSVLACAC